MSTAKEVKKHILTYKTGKPFSVRTLLSLGTRKAVDCVLARLVEKGVIVRVERGIYMRPKSTRYVENVAPGIEEVVNEIAKGTGETIGISGSEAALRLKLSTQVPMKPTYYTSGPSRELSICNQTVKLKHVSSRKLALAGKPSGIILSALWYLGKKETNGETLEKISESLEPSVLKKIGRANIPAWMANALHKYKVMHEMDY